MHQDGREREVIVVGAGPAGLSAALLLGRCRRRVLVVDAGAPRNARSHAIHGYLTREGIAPLELLALGREELRAYPSVELQSGTVTDARRRECGFEVELESGETFVCRKLVLATGVVDRLPEIEGLDALYGRSVFHCPFCDAWEVRDRPIGVYCQDESGPGYALLLSQWSADVTLFTDGFTGISTAERARLERRGVGLVEARVARLEGEDGKLERVVRESGEALRRDVLFFHAGKWLRSDLAERLGARTSPPGGIATGELEDTCVSGLYVAGDASYDVLLAIVAASEGAKAAFAINRELLREDLAGLR